VVAYLRNRLAHPFLAKYSETNYQETPYFAAIRRAFSSSVSRRFAWRFFTGLEDLTNG
jgi:hypothetical protein